MSALTFIRAADGATVDCLEACAPTGALKPGYRFGGGKTVAHGEHVGFNLAFMDAAPAPSAVSTSNLPIADAAARSFADTTAGQLAIAHARAGHDARQSVRSLGSQRAWSIYDAARAVQLAYAVHSANLRAADALSPGHALRDAARAKRVI